MPAAAHPSLPSLWGPSGCFPEAPVHAVVEMVGAVQKLEVPSGEPEHPAGWELQQNLPLTKRGILFQNKRKSFQQHIHVVNPYA